MVDEERGLWGCQGGGGDDEVAFVFPRFRVQDYDEVAARCGWWLVGVWGRRGGAEGTGRKRLPKAEMASGMLSKVGAGAIVAALLRWMYPAAKFSLLCGRVYFYVFLCIGGSAGSSE